MAETESITVAEVSDGPCASGRTGTAVDLPVVELLTGRGFITGKSGSGKSNTASVVAEKLLDNGFGLLIVDIDGEYYGLKEEYEILHAGADEECDIQVTTEHAEKIASLALEQNVPIILDVSSFLNEEEAQELLTEVSKRLFAKAKKLKQPFLMLVEEVHEYIPQKGSVGECGKMLIKISKRGRKHGLGVVGISQRPADVKKDFITQCDWLVWHRLTWNNDTKVVGRVLDTEYAEAVEDLGDGEAFLMTDWAEQITRVQFQRKKTFDAGATPGLDDFERPDLKSVSDDLVSELQSISEEKAKTEDRIAELREELDQKNSRIAELETELQDARDMQRMADQFTQALVDHVNGANPGRTEQERMRDRRQAEVGDRSTDEDRDARDDSYQDAVMRWPDPDEVDDEPAERGAAPTTNGSTPADATVAEGATSGVAATASGGANADTDSDDAGAASNDGLLGMATSFGDGDATETDADADTGMEADADTGTEADAATGTDADTTAATGAGATDASASNGTGVTDGGAVTSSVTRGFADVEENPLGDRATDAFESGTATAVSNESEDDATFSRKLTDDVRELDARTRQMLRYYRDHGPGTPMDALFAAGGSDDRTAAYARNRKLRVRGLVEHVGRGRYDYRLEDLLRTETESETVQPYVERVEAVLSTDGEDGSDIL